MSDASSRRSFRKLVDEALRAPVEGWDFSFVRGRIEEQRLPWDYHDIAGRLVESARRVLDVDTGGGEEFAALQPPPGSVAVEPYHPNVAVAAHRLGPLGIDVLERNDVQLPAPDAGFDLVLNRHGHLHPGETRRVLESGGRLLSQQVGAQNDVEFNEALGIPVVVDPAVPATLDQLVEGLERAGLVVTDAREANVVTRYLDVAAVIFQLRAVPWQAPGFDVMRHRPELHRLHEHIVSHGAFEVRSQRFLVQAHN